MWNVIYVVVSVQDEFLEGSFPTFDEAMDFVTSCFFQEEGMWTASGDSLTWENDYGDMLKICYEAVD